jgi:hypothetical protein
MTPYWKKSSCTATLEDTPRSNTSNKSKSSGSLLANAFLAAIQSASTGNNNNTGTTNASPHVSLPFVPLAEIHSNNNDDDDGATTGNDSMSAVSDDHFSTTRASFLNNNNNNPITSGGQSKKSSMGSWSAERNRVLAYSHPLSPTKRVTEQQQQQIIDERVRARVFDIERRMEDRLQDFMRNLELKMMTRLDELERRMECMLLTDSKQQRSEDEKL